MKRAYDKLASSALGDAPRFVAWCRPGDVLLQRPSSQRCPLTALRGALQSLRSYQMCSKNVCRLFQANDPLRSRRQPHAPPPAPASASPRPSHHCRRRPPRSLPSVDPSSRTSGASPHIARVRRRRPRAHRGRSTRLPIALPPHADGRLWVRESQMSSTCPRRSRPARGSCVRRSPCRAAAAVFEVAAR